MNAKKTSELKAGDIVHIHGTSLRLVSVKVYDGVHRWSTEYVGAPGQAIEDHGAYYGGEMESGRWAVQGNDFAVWSVTEANAQ